MWMLRLLVIELVRFVSDFHLNFFIFINLTLIEKKLKDIFERKLNL